MQLDVIGVDNVAEYIAATNKSKFTIFRAGTTGNAVPVYECNDNTTNGDAVKAFRQYAKFINNNNAYRIVLYDLVEEDEQGGTKRTKGRAGKMEALFAINESGTRFGSDEKPIQINPAEIEMRIRKEYEAKAEENKTLAKIEALELKILALQAEQEEDDDDEEEGGLLGALQNPQMLQGIQALAMALRGGYVPQPTQLNGTEEMAEQTAAEQQQKNNEIAARLNAAIKRLLAKDKKLPMHLEKLADIADKNPSQFSFLLQMLEQQ